MAFTRPSALPVWATGGTITTPSGPKQALGWVVEKPPLSFFNWFQNLVYQWLGYLDERAPLLYADTAALTAAVGPPGGAIGQVLGIGIYTYLLGDTTAADGEAVVTHALGRWHLTSVETGNLGSYADFDDVRDLVENAIERIEVAEGRIAKTTWAIETTTAVAAGTALIIQVPMASARVGDTVAVSTYSLMPAGLMPRAFVETSGVITLQVCNPTAGSLNTGVGTLSLTLIIQEDFSG